MADGYIQVPQDSTGKKVETTELTKSDFSVVERQRVSIGDTEPQTDQLLQQIIFELRDLKWSLLKILH